MAAIGRDLDPNRVFNQVGKPPLTRQCSPATETFQTLRLERRGQGDTEGLIVDTDTNTDEGSVPCGTPGPSVRRQVRV